MEMHRTQVTSHLQEVVSLLLLALDSIQLAVMRVFVIAKIISSAQRLMSIIGYALMNQLDFLVIILCVPSRKSNEQGIS